MKHIKLTAVLLLLTSGLALADNVKVYDRVPSAEELQQQLLGTPENVKKGPRTRAIVFGDAEPAAQAAAPTPAPPPAQPAHRPAPKPQAAVAQPQVTGSSQTVTSNIPVSDRAIALPINFRVNSAEILPESFSYLESVAGLLNKDPNMRLVVEGHTDASGSATKNLVLSRERAFSVMNYLIDQHQIDPLRLVPIGKGFSEPLGGMEATNPKNRRVQFRVMG